MNNQEQITKIKCECFDIDIQLGQLQAQANGLIEAKKQRFQHLEALLKAEHDAKVVADGIANATPVEPA